MNSVNTIEQGRAAFAYNAAKEGKDGKGGAKASEYKSYSKKIPTMIMTNGLGATLAFMFSKKGTYNLFLTQIADYLKESPFINVNNERDLIQKVTELNSTNYRALTKEIIALFSWLRRFAEGMIEKEE